jgi:hypothetical protein
MNRRLDISLAIALAITAIICLMPHASAEVTTYRIGDYVVSFDLGDSPLVTAFAPRADLNTFKYESLSGQVSIVYWVNETRGQNCVSIRIEELIGLSSSEVDKAAALSDVAETYLYDPTVRDLVFKPVDGNNALVIEFNNGHVVAVWCIETPTCTAVVSVGSTYPWGYGTGNFLQTVHIQNM